MAAGPLPIPKERPKFGAERFAAAANEENAPVSPKGPAGEISTSDALGLAFIDKGSLGILPWIHDKLVDWAPKGHKLGPKYTDTVLPAAAEQHPVASAIGGAGGMILPMGMAARGAQLAGVTGKYALGALGAAGGDVADQAVRTQTEGREFRPGEAALAGVTGAAGPLLPAALAAGVIHPAAAALPLLKTKLASSAFGGIYDFAKNALRAQVPEAAAAAERTLSGEAAQAARSTFDDAVAARTAKPSPRPAPLSTPVGEGPPVMRPKADMSGAGKGVPFQRDPFDFSPEPPPIRTQGPPRDPLDFSEFFEKVPGPPNRFASPPPGPPPPTPPGIRPSKLEPGSPMYEELQARIRAMATGQPLPPIQPAVPPVPPKPPGLMDLPYSRLGTAGGIQGGIEALDKPYQAKKRRTQKARQ